MLSLLGLVRHMADVEHYWFRQMMAGEDSPAPFHSAADPDEEFYAAQPDADAVEDDWQAWRREAALAESSIEQADSLDITGNDRRRLQPKDKRPPPERWGPPS